MNECAVLKPQCRKRPLKKVTKFQLVCDALLAAPLSLLLSAILMMAEGVIRPSGMLLTFTNNRLSSSPTIITILDCNYSLLLNYSGVR